MRTLLFLICICLTFSLAAQEKENLDLREEVRPNSRATNDMFNRQDASAALQSGGTFYASAPPATLELTPETAYLRPEWEELVIRTTTNETATVQGRYRLIDQKFEIKDGEDIYEIYTTMVREAQLGDDYFVVQSEGAEMVIYQVLYRDTDNQVLIKHTAEWQDPPQKNMFDTSEAVRKLKKRQITYLASNGRLIRADKKKDVLAALDLGQNQAAYAYFKKNRLNPKDEQDLIQLLTYINSPR
ncbi:hypothetical protein [Lewinella sp. 4G2]|uniref:hypothetical protein n=1 Tax=Lewinella sp. 4G2 TaxID=1803372 RepID=UPI0007B4B192|nr:hypothetical protein [Lewinella sp. 4G2]OAV43732.1 hypothetical protein A3850_004135 [Lewinella sp. 4G2]